MSTTPNPSRPFRDALATAAGVGLLLVLLHYLLEPVSGTLWALYATLAATLLATAGARTTLARRHHPSRTAG